MTRDELLLILTRGVASVSGSACAGGDFETCPDDNAGPCFCSLQAKAAIAAIESAGLKFMGRDVTKDELLMIYRSVRDIKYPLARDGQWFPSLYENVKAIRRAAFDAARTYSDGDKDA